MWLESRRMKYWMALTAGVLAVGTFMGCGDKPQPAFTNEFDMDWPSMAEFSIEKAVENNLVNQPMEKPRVGENEKGFFPPLKKEHYINSTGRPLPLPYLGHFIEVQDIFPLKKPGNETPYVGVRKVGAIKDQNSSKTNYLVEFVDGKRKALELYSPSGTWLSSFYYPYDHWSLAGESQSHLVIYTPNQLSIHKMSEDHLNIIQTFNYNNIAAFLRTNSSTFVEDDILNVTDLYAEIDSATLGL